MAASARFENSRNCASVMFSIMLPASDAPIAVCLAVGTARRLAAGFSAVLTVIGSVCFRILWVLYVLPLNPTYLMLMLVYPASWIVTGAVMQLACHRYMGKLGR